MVKNTLATPVGELFALLTGSVCLKTFFEEFVERPI